MSTKNVVTLSRPKDKSLKSYKAWIMSLTAELSGKPEKDDMTQKEWIKLWKEFWGKSGKGEAGSENCGHSGRPLRSRKLRLEKFAPLGLKTSIMRKKYYISLRNKYIPKNLKIVFVLESPPASGKYFYDKNGRVSEPLFSAMMKLLEFEPQDKREGLKYFAESGYFLVDATYEPVNTLKGKNRKDKILENYPNLFADLRKFCVSKQIKVILVKANICRLLKQRLLDDGFNVLNQDEIVPFPSTGWQNRFQEAVSLLIQ
jgi:hypothetical protein